MALPLKLAHGYRFRAPTSRLRRSCCSAHYGDAALNRGEAPEFSEKCGAPRHSLGYCIAVAMRNGWRSQGATGLKIPLAIANIVHYMFLLRRWVYAAFLRLRKSAKREAKGGARPHGEQDRTNRTVFWDSVLCPVCPENGGGIEPVLPENRTATLQKPHILTPK